MNKHIILHEKERLTIVIYYSDAKIRLTISIHKIDLDIKNKEEFIIPTSKSLNFSLLEPKNETESHRIFFKTTENTTTSVITSFFIKFNDEIFYIPKKEDTIILNGVLKEDGSSYFASGYYNMNSRYNEYFFEKKIVSLCSFSIGVSDNKSFSQITIKR